MYKITLLSVLKTFRHLCGVCLVLFSSLSIYGLDSVAYSSYNFGLFSPVMDVDTQNKVPFYGPLTAEEAGYRYEESAVLPDMINIQAGSVIIDMGVVNQTYANAIKPYGLVYTLLDDDKIPVIWSIDKSKNKDDADFQVDGRSFAGGPFIIAEEYLTAAVQAKINNWESMGVVTYETSTSFDAPLYRILDAAPVWAINNINTNIVTSYLNAAGIKQLDSDLEKNWIVVNNAAAIIADGVCADIFAMPHNDNVTWNQYGGLIELNEHGMWIWAGCKAVSELESVENPNGPEKLNFLSTTGLVDADDHDDASGNTPYDFDFHEEPFMQFIGQTDGAHANGAEEIYLPKNSGGWRPETSIPAWDVNQSDIAGISPEKRAALIAYGPAFGVGTNGYVMYEAGHKLNDRGSIGERVAAQRAFFNFALEGANKYGKNRTNARDDYNNMYVNETVTGNVLTNDFISKGTIRPLQPQVLHLLKELQLL
jgi:hypothetical protein